MFVSGDLEFIQKDIEEDIDLVVNIVDHLIFEAAVRGLEKIQKMNRINCGVDRKDKLDDKYQEMQIFILT